MQGRGSPQGYSNEFSDSLVRPGRVLDNPAVQQRFFGADESATGPSQFRFDPRGAHNDASDDPAEIAKHARHRNRAVWAQALVLFNVVGIPLSQGVYLESYFTGALTRSSLVALAIIPGLQILCILCTPVFVGWMFQRHRHRWRLMFFVATVIAICAQLPLQFLDTYISILILQGPLLGAALGTLFTLSTLVLSSHYRFNLPLVSTMGGCIGFVGAVVYSVIASLGSGHYAAGVTACVLAATLVGANLLVREVKGQTRRKLDMAMPKGGISSVWKEDGTTFFVAGYILIFFAIFMLPIYTVLLLSQQRTLGPSNTGFHALLATLALAAASACLSANPVARRRLGPVNTFIAAAVLAGAVSISPSWISIPWLSILAGAGYGIGLGAIVALHIRVSTVFHEGRVVCCADMPARAAIMMALGGVSAFVGLLVSAILMESLKSGVRISSAVAAGCLVLGGLCVAVGRWKRCAGWGVAI